MQENVLQIQPEKRATPLAIPRNRYVKLAFYFRFKTFRNKMGSMLVITIRIKIIDKHLI